MTFPLELDSAFEDLPFPGLLAAISLFSALRDLSRAAVSLISAWTVSRASFWWRVSRAFFDAWLARAVLRDIRVNASLRLFLRTPVSIAANTSAATFSSHSRALG